MIYKNLTLLVICLFVCVSCIESKSKTEISKVDLKTICNNDSLFKWSTKTIKEKEKDFILSNNTNIETAEGDGYISVVWQYDITNNESLKDDYVQYCIDLISEKMDLPENFNLKFDYILNASCPIDADLPIEVNSEIKNLRLINSYTFTQYDFDIIRGRLESSVKYLKESPNKVTDTIYLTY